MAEEYDYERVLLVKPDVFIYRIPPRTSNRGYRASDWKLDEPDWTGRLRVVAKGSQCILKLEDKNTGQLFAQCPVEKYPGLGIESVSDSSRYFVLKIVSDAGKSAFIGIGFADRGDSFDLNVALQDHFKIIEKEAEAAKADDSAPKLDLKFRDGETIKVNLNIAKKSTSRSKTSGSKSGTGILLPPPPSASTSASVRSNSLTGEPDGAGTVSRKESDETQVTDRLNELSVTGSVSSETSSSGPAVQTGWAQF